ncbi:hypothetical protein BDV93DRAFT_604019 [Ceratobasidium sp. AG-I]|nr:hypothetical protein BDV93DRAFT_604019 [Ceratobasidium sp. AG-I]
MSGWSFNLRSGSNSDSEDDTETNSPSNTDHIAPAATNSSLQDPVSHPLDVVSRTPQNDNSKELEELFGGIEDDAVVNYKPNPWNIAKINANSRPARTGPAKSVRPASKPLEVKAAGNKRFFVTKPRGAGANLTSVSHFSAKQPSPPKRSNEKPASSLCDSISAALRREAATTFPISASMDTPTVGPVLETYGAPPAPQALSLDERATESIPASESVHDADDAPALTSDNPSSDSLVLSDEPYDALTITTSPRVRIAVDQAYFEATPYNTGLEYPISPIPNISPTWNTQRVSSGYADDNTSNELERAYQEQHMLGYTPTASLSMLEHSPTLRLIAEFAKARPRQEREGNVETTSQSEALENSQADCDREGSPTFAWYPPSPIREDTRPTSYSHGNDYKEQNASSRAPKRKHRDFEVDSSSPISSYSTRHLTPARQPITPPRNSAKKRFAKPIRRLDFEEEPIWSTLPIRGGAKQAKSPNEITTARFQLPGTFLGSSPPSDRGNPAAPKALYKPPTRKRSHSGDVNAGEGSKWKLTRIV